MKNFADRVIELINTKNTCVCVGLDPNPELIPQEISRKTHSTPSAIFEFNKSIIDIVKDYAVAVKPQSAFYERYHSEGVKCFFDTIEYAHKQGLIVIADVKRSDIASTAQAYAEAYLENSSADSITVNPFLGVDSIEPFTKSCADKGKGLFILLKTSNPGSKDFQDVVLQDGRKLYELIAEKISIIGKGFIGTKGYSSVGAVVGATFPEEARIIRGLLPLAIFLVPGYGAQGAKADDLRDYFNTDGVGAIINASRSIIYAYENPTKKNWQDAIQQAVIEMNNQINQVRKNKK
ncbi:MAG: orotidine-5'-phosphate decarboxylase [Planctomycetota bacterium]|nr:orotidine-5'-phosphate decarboxylase [Planctomycetota bacterium]MDI6787136.1 orotidine-5'-phosphate decarboxylase [Planctomycetota bacterium]